MLDMSKIPSHVLVAELERRGLFSALVKALVPLTPMEESGGWTNTLQQLEPRDTLPQHHNVSHSSGITKAPASLFMPGDPNFLPGNHRFIPGTDRRLPPGATLTDVPGRVNPKDGTPLRVIGLDPNLINRLNPSTSSPKDGSPKFIV